VNPSANQLYLALGRRNKPIDASVAPSMASVHAAVTRGSWEAVMVYERLHHATCSNPRLQRFQGMDGIYSPKAKWIQWK
jgi:cytochrome c heme-lyase